MIKLEKLSKRSTVTHHVHDQWFRNHPFYATETLYFVVEQNSADLSRI